jgi:hypothetical protein
MRKAFLGPVILLMHITPSTAQKIDSALNAFTKQFSSEKMYIHYNKSYH